MHCLHCNEEYDSYLIKWVVTPDRDGKPWGHWACPIPGCDGAGFCFDIWPVDPEWRNEDGEKVWCDDDEDDDAEGDDDWVPDDDAALLDEADEFISDVIGEADDGGPEDEDDDSEGASWSPPTTVN